MSATAEKLKSQLAALSFEDRAEVIRFLIELNGPEWVPNDDPEWEAELNRRLEEFTSGRDPGKPGEQVVAEIREKLACGRISWKAELDRRMEEIESGRDPGKPVAQVLAEIDEKYGWNTIASHE